MFIDDLANRAELIPALARWHLAQWAYLNPGDALERRITRLQNHCGDDAIPTTFVACAGATPGARACCTWRSARSVAEENEPRSSLVRSLEHEAYVYETHVAE